jgi:hypothetical protein
MTDAVGDSRASTGRPLVTEDARHSGIIRSRRR